jgi:hypothetical protein
MPFVLYHTYWTALEKFLACQLRAESRKPRARPGTFPSAGSPSQLTADPSPDNVVLDTSAP